MQKLLAIDTETGGLSPEKHSLLTIGMIFVVFKDKKYEIVEELHILIKHEKYSVEKQAQEVHKISIEEHDKIALPIIEAKLKIKEFMTRHKLFDTNVCGQNIIFDVGFLKKLYDEKEYPFHYHYVDTKNIWCYLKLQEKIPYGLGNSLKDMANYFGIDYNKAHDAIEDCKITIQVLEKMLKL